MSKFKKIFASACCLCLLANLGWANSAPTDINASNLSIAENSAIGTVISEFNATDPDGDTNITYSLVLPLPRDLNLSLWLDASDESTITHSNGSVSQWADKSGNNKHLVQATSSKRPITDTRSHNDLNVINFNGAQWMKSNSDFATGSDFSVFIFSKIDVVNHVNDSLFCLTTNDPDFQIDAGAENEFRVRFLQSGMGADRTFSSLKQHNPSIWSFVFDFSGSNEITAFKNSQQLGNPATYTTVPKQSTNTFNLFSNRAQSHFPSGYVGELIFVGGNLSTEKRERIERYLSFKWMNGNFSDSFSMDTNGTLRAKRSFDYETDDRNYSITVFATDDHNASFDKNFTVQITNVVEDLDGDGTEDHYDDDIDGDGLTNAQELLYGSDPLDAGSRNRPPSDINASNLSIAENSAIGTVIGEFNATDPDGDTNITFSIIPYPARLWLDAADAESVVHSDGNLSRWKNQVSSQHDAVAPGGFHGLVRYLPDGLGDSLPAIDPNKSFLTVLDSNESFDEWEKLTISMVYKWTNRGSWNDALWKTSSGASTTKGYSIAKMNVTTQDQGTGFWYGLEHSTTRLYGSTQTQAIYEPKVLTVVGDGSTGVVKLYANGVQIRSASNFPPRLVQAREHDVRIGGGHLFSEILIYEDALDATERGSLESYLMGKWVPGYKGFSIDQNGTLRTSSVYDYETDDQNHTITVWATDQLGASFDKNFTVQITNFVEDLDGDGTEDHYDDDIDGDGLTNAEELAYNSDPRDASSYNRPPGDLNVSNLSIAENSAIGSVIGEFNATDLDGDTNITYSIIPYPPRLWLDAADAESVVHSDGKLSRWKNKVSSQHDAVLLSGNIKYLPDGLGGSLPAIDTSNGTLKVLDSNESFDEWEKLTISMVYKWTSRASWSKGLWKGTGATWPKEGYSITNLNVASNQGFGIFYGTSAGTATGRLDGGLQSEAIYGPKVLTVVGNGSSGSAKLFIDGAQIRSASNFPPRLVQVREHDVKIGGDHLFSEILIYEDALDATERGSLESYLMGKWVPGYKGFSIDQNGTLRTSGVYDYETDDQNHTITVWATDQIGASFDKNFTVQITNIVEDLDGDGTEDHYDDDIDGDGLTNAEELAYNSDPRDASSYNRPPGDLNVSNLSIAENSAIGSVIGEFNATDPDGDTNITYSIIPYPPRLWLDAADAESVVHSDGNLSRWKNQVSSQHDAVAPGGFHGLVRYLPDGLGDSLPAIDPNKSFLTVLDSNLSFDEWEKLTISMVYKWTNRGSWNDALWKNPADRSKGYSIAKMNVTTSDQGTGFWYGLKLSSTRLVGSTQTEAINEPKVLTVVGDGSTGVVKLYANGVEIRSASNFPSRLVQAREYDVRIGGDHLFSEILIYEDALDATERGSLESYLMGKWVPGYKGFSIDQNGTLRTSSIYDYETDDQNHTITVWATDQLGASFDKNFTVQITNVYEDIVDTDGDGFRDSLEASTGSNLNDPNSTPLQQGLVAWYPFDGNASDMSGNGNHGTVNGATLGTDYLGEANSSYSFDGQNDYIEISSSETLSFSDEVSFAFWMKPTKWGTENTKLAGVLSKKRSDSHAGFVIYHDYNRQNKLNYRYRGTNSANGYLPSSKNIPINFWQHWVVTQSSNKVFFYYAGLLEASHSISNAGLISSDYPLHIGNAQTWSSTSGDGQGNTYFQGSIDDIRIYNRALSADEISLLYRAESPNHFVDSAKDLEMIWVEPGTFTMGSPTTEVGHAGNEELHEVTLTKGFYLGKYEVTQAQYEAVMSGNNQGLSRTPSHFSNNPNHPVEKVSWSDVQEFLRRLNEEQANSLPSGWAYALPTEAQWEYACRAGSTTPYYWGENASTEKANYSDSNANQTLEVGQYSPNPWGLYDMHGNVFEWVNDWGASYGTIPVTDPLGPDSGSYRVARGGSWLTGASVMRAAKRLQPGHGTASLREKNVGFRLALRDMNKAPTDLNSTAVLAVLENLPAGQVIGEFNATDPDGDAITYHFVSGDNNNSLFTLDTNGTLKTATTFDYESNATSYTITVQAKDELNATTEGNFTVTLLDDKSDNPPSDLWLSNAQINENTAVGTEVAQVVPLDARYIYKAGQGIGSHVVILRNASHMGVQFIKGEVLNVTLIGNGGTVNGVTIYRPQVNKGPTWLPLNGRGDWWERVFPGVSLVLESGNEGVSLDGQTGMLSVNRIFDYETDGASHSFSVRAEREGMHDFNKFITLTITDIFEDLDQDGTEDHFDDDIDGDGFTNSEELAYGSDPRSSATLPLNDSNFMSAINLWFDAERNATALYGHISDWNVSAVTYMNDAFRGREYFNENISKWDTSLVTRMDNMFSGASSFNQPIGEWNTSSVRLMYQMFNGATSFNQDISEWNTSSVTSIYGMFRDASSFNEPIGGWDTSSVKKMGSMFLGASSFDQSLAKWNVSSVEKMNGMFFEASSLSNLTKREIHQSFSSNENWPYDWSPHIANSSPVDLNTTDKLSVTENNAVGLVLGRFTGTDPENDAITFSLAKSEGSEPYPFQMEENGTLRAAKSFDYETDEHNYTITIVAKDEYNATTEVNFTITLLNVVEDFDKDGIEDHYDLDDDNDGFSDAGELAYGSDPLDSKSVANKFPNSLELIGSKILENQPKGTIIGRLIGHDPDYNTTLIYSQVLEGNQTQSPVFVSPTGVVRTTRMFDYETNEHNYTLVARVSDEHNFSKERSFTIHLLNVIEDLDKDGVEDFYDEDVDGDGFTNQDEITFGSDPLDADSLINRTPDDITMIGGRVKENEKVGTVVARFFGMDVDGNESLTFTLIEYRNEWDFHRTSQIDDSNKGSQKMEDSNDSKVSQSTDLNSTRADVFDANKTDHFDIFDETDSSLSPSSKETVDKEFKYPNPFVLSPRGVLRTNRILDFERDPSIHFVKIRVADEYNASIDRNFSIRLINVIEDLDEDGVEDFYDDDIDGDGFMNRREFAYGSDPLDPNSVANTAPDLLKLKGTNILENQPKGTIVGRLIGHDPDPNATLIYSQVLEGNQTQSPVFVSPMGVVRTIRVFDYETNEHNYTLVARVSDEHNFSKERSFTIHLLNVIEDLDKDGVEDFYDEDIDGDGFTNQDEITFGSDPLDADSLINRTPDDITMIGGRVKENEKVGTVVARFFGMDVDGNESLTFTLIEYRNEWDFTRTSQIDYSNKGSLKMEDSNDSKVSQSTDLNSTRADVFDANKTDHFDIFDETNSSLSPSSKETVDKEFKYPNPFVLSPRGVLRTNRILDFERDPPMHFVKIRVADEYNASIDRNFSIRLVNVKEDLDGDGTEDFYDEDIDGDGFSNQTELAEGTNPKDQYSYTNQAILDTGEVDFDANGSFILRGSVLATGQGAINDFGFVISSGISLDREKSTVYWVRAVGKPTQFQLKVEESPFEKVMYFRAWAKNVAGYGIGPVKKVRLDEAPQLWWGDVIERPGGWKISEWFGSFRDYENGWLYHARLGWLYASAEKKNGVWLWKDGRGWLWTNQSAWPYLWWNQSKNWLYLVPSKPGERIRFYDYSTDSYR